MLPPASKPKCSHACRIRNCHCGSGHCSGGDNSNGSKLLQPGYLPDGASRSGRSHPRIECVALRSDRCSGAIAALFCRLSGRRAMQVGLDIRWANRRLAVNPPEILEPVRRQRRIDRRTGDRSMTERSRDRPGTASLHAPQRQLSFTVDCPLTSGLEGQPKPHLN
jgi:hypothetical protein